MPPPNYNYGNQPSAIAVGAASEQLFTAYQLAQDSPQHRRQLMERHGMKKNWFATLKELGLGSPLSGPTLGHYERDWIRNNFQIGSIVTAPTGAGQPGTYALASGSMYSTNLPGIGAMAFSFPAEFDIVHLPNGKSAQIIKKITNVTPHQIILKPSNAADTLVGAVVANGRYFIGDNALPEGSRSVAVKVPRYFKYTNDVQIIKSRFAETGSSMTNQLPFRPIEGMEGSFLVEGTAVTELLQMDRISKALFFGKRNNNYTGFSEALGHDVPIKTTQGLDDYIEQEGNILNITPGSIGMADFDALGEIQNRERVPSTTSILALGYNLNSELNNVLKDFMDNTCFGYAAGSFPNSSIFEGTNPQDHFLWLDFAGVRKNSRNWLFKHQAELDEQMGAGTEGYNYKNTGYVIPVDTFESSQGSSVKYPTVGYQYKALNGYSREWEFSKFGGAGLITKTSDLDAMTLAWLSEIGAHNGLGNQMIKLKP